MPDAKNKPYFKRIVYNKAVHGGAKGAIILDTLPDGLVIGRVTANVVTGVTSTGSATISLGTQASTTAILSTEAKTSFDTEHEIKDVNDLAIKVVSGVSDQLTMTIGTEVLATGVVEFYVQGFMAEHSTEKTVS